MPSTEVPGEPQELHSLTEQYHRLERIASASVAVVVGALFLGTYLTTALLPAVAVAIILIAVVRTPVFRSSGIVRLQTDDNPEVVLERFTDPRPPILAFQWAVADKVTTDEHGASYSFSYLFGLRSTEMTVRTQTETAAEGTTHVELAITVRDNPWGTYTATIEGTEDGSIIDVEYTSDRRFGLRRVPQQALGERYRDKVLDAQGFTVVGREAHVGISHISQISRR